MSTTLASGYELDGLGLPVWKPSAELQAEMDALPRTNSEDPLIEEQRAEHHEMNCNRVAKFKWEGQEQFEHDRLGRILSMGEFLRLLHQIDPSFYYNNWTTGDGLVGLNVIYRGQPKYICAVQLGMMPEYETLRVNEWGLPGRSKYRGWRTVLLNLMDAGAITEEDADRVFGKATGPESGPYLKACYQKRNRRVR